MNAIKYLTNDHCKIVYCIVDNTRSYMPSIKDTVKNQADGVLSNLINKHFNVMVWLDEDELLEVACDSGFEYAVVLSTGTEFTNGTMFFTELDKLLDRDFFIAGHILDRQEAYYELHQQCYVINLKQYQALGKPRIGDCEFYVNKTLSKPNRSQDNYHDDYTPTWIEPSGTKDLYKHCRHGWNLINQSLENNLPCIVFNDTLRNSKFYLYPESEKDFYKQLSHAYDKLHYCAEEFVHTQATETIDLGDTEFTQIVTPASSDWFLPYIKKGTVIYYDYNQKSLDYWQQHSAKIPGIDYKFVRCDLLGTSDFVDSLENDPATLINLSNVFNYEGTYVFYSQKYRQFKQDQLIEKIKRKCPQAKINFSMPATVSKIIPTWHL